MTRAHSGWLRNLRAERWATLRRLTLSDGLRRLAARRLTSASADSTDLSLAIRVERVDRIGEWMRIAVCVDVATQGDADRPSRE